MHKKRFCYAVICVVTFFFSISFLFIVFFWLSFSLLNARECEEKTRNRHLNWTYMGKHNNSTLEPLAFDREGKKLGYLIMMWFYYVSVRLDGVCVLVCVPLPIEPSTLDNNVRDDKCTRNVFFIWYPRRLNFDSISGGERFHCCCRCCCYAIIIIITPLGTFCYGQCQKITHTPTHLSSWHM